MKKLSKQAGGQQADSEAAYYAQLYLLSFAEPDKKTFPNGRVGVDGWFDGMGIKPTQL